MLKVVNSLEPWLFSELIKICHETLGFCSENVDSNYEESSADMHKVQACYEDLTIFFEVDRGKLFLWEEQGAYASVCRVELDQGSCILHDLVTKPDARRKGNGRKLLLSTIEYLAAHGADKVTVHIKKSNMPSLALHMAVGFLKVKDTARLLDGTVSSDYITMEYLIK